MLELNHLYREKGQFVKPYGRTIFFTSKGYVGVGPMADNRPENNKQAAQTSDKVACLAGLDRTVILRQDLDGVLSICWACLYSPIS
jgi:hypothetical protein